MNEQPKVPRRPTQAEENAARMETESTESSSGLPGVVPPELAHKITDDTDELIERHGVELIGARAEVIAKAEDRLQFRDAMARIGLECPKSRLVHSPAEAQEALAAIGLPAIIRPSFTLGGIGGGIAYNREEFESAVATGLATSPVHEVLVEESVLGWKEFEMEVVRDRADNCIIIDQVGKEAITDAVRLQNTVEAQAGQLHIARYAFHKVKCKVYGDAVANGQMSVEEARHHYVLAMINYDKLIEAGACGSFTEANQAVMDRGFPL
tara:strand:- start:20227 stop:21027 length:801 start_codon:yes stop_codon:yes gene_type:complete